MIFDNNPTQFQLKNAEQVRLENKTSSWKDFKENKIRFQGDRKALTIENFDNKWRATFSKTVIGLPSGNIESATCSSPYPTLSEAVADIAVNFPSDLAHFKGFDNLRELVKTIIRKWS